MKILTSEINDSTFNGESDTYSSANAARVSFILDAAIDWKGDFDPPSILVYVWIQVNELNIVCYRWTRDILTIFDATIDAIQSGLSSNVIQQVCLSPDWVRMWFSKCVWIRFEFGCDQASPMVPVSLLMYTFKHWMR